MVWLAIKHTPATNATQRDKQVFTGLSAALTAYLGSVIIKPEGEAWNAVRSSVKGVFAKSFTQRRTPIEKDARDAVQLDGYGAQARNMLVRSLRAGVGAPGARGPATSRTSSTHSTGVPASFSAVQIGRAHV